MIGLYFLIPAFNVHIFKPTEELATAEVEANPETETLATEMKTKKCVMKFKCLHLNLYIFYAFCSSNYCVLFHLRDNFLLHLCFLF